MSIETIHKQTVRRYVLGRQGLWPGRRYAGKTGVAQAICASECIQIDTINIIARSHELALWSRVVDYDAAWLDTLLYQERLFFDYGTILMIYPASDLRYFLPVMQRFGRHVTERHHTLHAVRAHVLDEIQRRGPLAGRDFGNRTRIPGGFNTVKDTGQALYHLYLSGHVMTHGRRNFERVYDLAPNVVRDINASGLPAETHAWQHGFEPATEAQAEHHFARKALRDLGLATGAEWARRVTVMRHERVSARTGQKRLEELAQEGIACKVHVEGLRETYYYPAEDRLLLHSLATGTTPDAWRPQAATTDAEVNFLAPLDNVIWDRARLQSLFDFEYVWEVYKPAATRRWGYYTLPVLYGDQFVARIAPRLERRTRTLHLDGLWLEASHDSTDERFLAALAAGLIRFAHFHDAATIAVPCLADPAANYPSPLRVLLSTLCSAM